MTETQTPVSSGFGKRSTAEEVTTGVDLSGKVAVITGVNSGLGFETMRVLALRGAHVIGTARTMEKARAACESVTGKTTPLACELTDFESIKACTDEIRAMGMPIDMLICNAGIMAVPELEQVQGLEKHFVTNHLSHFLFTLRLLDQIKAAPAARIVVLSSSGHKMAPEAGIEFDNLSGERDYKSFKAYGQSKLANGLFAKELARRLKDTAVTAHALNPGAVATNLTRQMAQWKVAIATFIGKLFLKTPEQGAATICYVATSPDLKNVTGLYFVDCNPAEPSAHMKDDALAARLWQVSEDLVKDYI